MHVESSIEQTQEKTQLGRGLTVPVVVVIVGVIAMVVSILAGYQGGWGTFFRSYILNYAFIVSLALGGLFFVLVQHATGAGWSVVVRRIAEAIAASLPWLGLLGLPILIPVLTGMAEVYPWANAEEVAHDPLLLWKQPYLNAPFFIVRLIVYFAIWSVIASMYYRYSVLQDRTGDQRLTLRMQRFAGFSILLFGFTITFFSIDLIQSMTPHWYSTMYGVYFFAGSIVSFFALLSLVMFILQQNGYLEQTITAEHYHDIGKFVWAFTIFWAYIAFSQYMLIWYANLPEETAWYHARQQSTWWIVIATMLIVGHFLVPFAALMSRQSKRRKAWLATVAVWVILLHWIDIYYLVGPRAHHLHTGEAHTAHANLQWTDLTLLVGLGGLFASIVYFQLRRAALLPVRDPRLNESLTFENL